MYQKVFIVGRVGNDVELRETPSGLPVMNISIAAHSGFGENRVTTWFRVSVFGRQAELCKEFHVGRGSILQVTGRITPDPETGGPRVFHTEGHETARSSYEVIADDITFIQTNSDA